MTKAELIEKIAEQTGNTKKDSSMHLETLIEIIENELQAGRDILIAGLGSFKVTHRKARNGRNPQTGELLKIKASKNVAFKASKNLKEKLNK